MRKALSSLIAGLAEGEDLEKLLRRVGLSLGQAARALLSPKGQSQMESRRVVAQAQVHLQTSLCAARAVALLKKLLKHPRPEVRLRAAMALLTLSLPRKGRETPAAGMEGPVDPVKAMAVMEAQSGPAVEQRRREMMGSAPVPPETDQGEAVTKREGGAS